MIEVDWDEKIREWESEIEEVMAPLEAKLEQGELLSDEEMRRPMPLALKIPDPRTILDPTRRKQLTMLRHRLYSIQTKQYSLKAARERQGLNDEWDALHEALRRPGISVERREELLEQQARVSAKIRFLEQ